MELPVTLCIPEMEPSQCERAFQFLKSKLTVGRESSNKFDRIKNDIFIILEICKAIPDEMDPIVDDKYFLTNNIDLFKRFLSKPTNLDALLETIVIKKNTRISLCGFDKLIKFSRDMGLNENQDFIEV